jgi:lipopolysaccharide transport system ATP-binding protein
VVDEVLAVGDFSFQKKCLGRMGDVAHEGRTVLFVSHNMGAISALCSRAVLLEGGRLVEEGPTEEVVSAYVNRGLDASGEKVWRDEDEAPGSKILKLHAVRVVQRGVATADVEIDDEVQIETEFYNYVPGTCAAASIHLLDKTGAVVFATANTPSATLQDDGWSCRPHPAGLYRTTCTIPANFLNEGIYKVSAFVLKDVARIEAQSAECVSFTVHDTGAMRKEFTGVWIGAIRPRLQWDTEMLEPAEVGAGEERLS